jgi:hypothetical protein
MFDKFFLLLKEKFVKLQIDRNFLFIFGVQSLEPGIVEVFGEHSVSFGEMKGGG